jgi:glycosyltransferase involved in cell wall biosynthesis
MIYIDVSAAVHSRAGLGRYSEQVAVNVDQERPGRIKLFHNLGRDGRLPESLAHLPQQQVKAGYKPWRMTVLLAHLGRLSFGRLVPGAELFHSTEHLLMPLRGAPTVLTIHDLIYKLYPGYHKRLNYWFLNLAMPLFCQRATAIIAVSEASRQDIITHYQVDPAKIHVVYEAAAEHFRPPSPEQIAAVRERYQLPDRFLLHLSTIEPRKNLDRLVDALKLLRHDFPDLCLVLAGSKGWLYDDFFARITAENLEDVVRPLGWVPDEDLPAVIGAAVLAVQPSLYEGFGLPILEHMACGQVVAASNSSSHPEVGGEAAAYFSPEDTAEMTSTIRRLLHNPAEYLRRRELGLVQAAKFSWTRAARETIAVYEQVLREQNLGSSGF